MYRSGCRETTVSDSWSFSKRKRSTASSGAGYFVTIKPCELVNDYKQSSWLCQ